MHSLVLNIHRLKGCQRSLFEIRRLINAGFVGRDQSAVRAHLEELAREGIEPPAHVPMLFPVLRSSLTTSNQIEVVGERTSGEAEFVLLLTDKSVYVGVGSDHTDRELETLSMLNSKQVCPNVLSRDVWDFEEMREQWDRITLRSWVRNTPQDPLELYQASTLSAILPADEILQLVRNRTASPDLSGTVIFSGTVPIVTQEMVFGTEFQCELFDPVLNRSLRCEYSISRLDYIREDEVVSAAA